MTPAKTQAIYYQRKGEITDMEKDSHSVLGAMMNLKNTRTDLVRAIAPALATLKCSQVT